MSNLWCINIAGPDDVVAAASREDAIRLSHRFNQWWIDTIVARGLDEHEPTMWAAPIPWPHTADGHAADLARTDSEYAWLRASP